MADPLAEPIAEPPAEPLAQPVAQPAADRVADEVPALVLDVLVRGWALPVIYLARALPEVPVGRVVMVLADDPAATSDVPAWCRMRGHDYLGTSGTAAATGYLVRRSH